GGVKVFDPFDISERFFVTPLWNLRCDFLNGWPKLVIELSLCRLSLSLHNRASSSVVASKYKPEPVRRRFSLGPGFPKLAIVVNPARNVPIRIVHIGKIGIRALDFFERGWHQLHDPDRAHPAPSFWI